MYVPLHTHSWCSLLDGIGNPKKIAKRVAELGMPAYGLTDHGNVSGAVAISQELRKVGVKPILGCELYLCRHSIPRELEEPDLRKMNGRPYHHLPVLAKNAAGWRNLLKVVSRSHDKGHKLYDPRVYVEELEEHKGTLFAFSGHPGSELANALFRDPKSAYGCTNMQTLVESHLDKANYVERMTRVIEKYISVFGRENFALEIQILDPDRMVACVAIAKVLRWFSKKMKIPCVATHDAHMVRREDASDQRTLLCSKFGLTHRRVKEMLQSDEDMALAGFFQSDAFHILDEPSMLVHHTPEELAMTNRIAEMIDDYDITSKPRMPHFECPDGLTADQHLAEMCEQRYRDKIESREDSLKHPISEYRSRLDEELELFRRVGLSGYWLIVEDAVRFALDRGWILGEGRGSAAGSLIAHLLDITGPDPLEYDLLLSRFYNSGRNSGEHVSMPDIDLDFPAIRRDQVFEHLKRKYGEDKVAKIATFQTLQGRAALDAVFRAFEVPFDEAKAITAIIPDKARIAEELQDMADRGEEPSIIRYALETYPNELSDYCRLEDDGSLSGNYAAYFAQAMRLEGTKSVISTHAAGIVIAPESLSSICPMHYDTGSGAYVAAWEMKDIEAAGLLKLDALSILNLNKSEAYRDLLAHGRILPLA